MSKAPGILNPVALDAFGGEVFLPAGTALYRKAPDTSLRDLMWWSFHPFDSLGYQGNMQRWIMKQPLHVPFIIDHFQHRRYVISRFPESLCGMNANDQDAMNLLEWKQNDNDHHLIAERLSRHFGWAGWVASQEDKSALEVCLTKDAVLGAEFENQEDWKYNDSIAIRNSLRDVNLRITAETIRKSTDAIRSVKKEMSLDNFIQLINLQLLEAVRNSFPQEEHEREMEAHYDFIYHLEYQQTQP